MLQKLFAYLLAFLLTGCVTNRMQVSETQELTPPGENQSQLVFMRSSYTGQAIQASVFDVADGTLKFVGIVNNSTKIALNTSPGKHSYMVVSESAEFLAVELAAGKTYYSSIVPHEGNWKTRFSLIPFKKNSSAPYALLSNNFHLWRNQTLLVENTARSLQWFNNNKADIQALYQLYWPQWLKQAEDSRAQRSLQPIDGL